MPRVVSADTLARAGAGASQPLYLLQIDWASYTSYLCSHGTLSWSGKSWFGADIAIRFYTAGRPAEITLNDYDASYRTLILGSGITDRRIRIWQGYVEALGDADPALLFDGYADGASIANGKVTFNIDFQQTAVAYAPRERIGPRIGVNFLGSVGETVRWGNTVLTLNPRTVQG